MEVIEWSAFQCCTALASITIPASVMEIGCSAFADCPSLASISVSEGNEVYDSRDNCNAIIHTATNILILGCPTTVIPHSVTEIGADAFYGCTALTAITIPDSVKVIGSYAFSGCTGLTSITLPSSVREIGESVFENCTGLTSITIPNSVKKIGEYAFWGCDRLTDS